MISNALPSIGLALAYIYGIRIGKPLSQKAMNVVWVSSITSIVYLCIAGIVVLDHNDGAQYWFMPAVAAFVCIPFAGVATYLLHNREERFGTR